MEYKSNTYDKYTWLPSKLIKLAFDQGWENSLCYLIALKKVYRKPIFYQYSLRKVSALVGCSPACLSHHLKKLSEMGCISIINGNLHLTGSKALNKLYTSQYIAVKHGENKQELLLHLRFTQHKRNFHQQIKVNTIKDNIIKMHQGVFFKYKEVKRLRRLEKLYYPSLKLVESSKKDYLTLSNQKFGSLVRRSKSTGIKIQKQLNLANLIKSERNFEFYSKEKFDRRSFFELHLGSNYQLSGKGYIYRVLPNKVSLVVQEV